MKRKKAQLGGIMLVGIIIISTFVYAIEIQPVASGDLNSDIYKMMGVSSHSKQYFRLLELLTNRFFLPWRLLNRGINTYELNSFSSYDDLAEFLKNNCNNYNYYGWHCELDSVSMPAVTLAKSTTAESGSFDFNGGSNVDYSQTNIQVEGVDEPDTVKTDGTYLYIVANSKVYIVKAYPAEEAAVLSEISLESDMQLRNIFINSNRLIIFGTSYRYPPVFCDTDTKYWHGGVSSTTIQIYDISDRGNPDLLKDMEIDGTYFDARMIGDNIYVIAAEYTYDICRTFGEGEEQIIDMPEITINEVTRKIPANQIYYVDIPKRIDTMTHVISINIDGNEVSQKSFLLGSSQNMYVSENNIFLAYTKAEYIPPLVEDGYGHYEEMTVLHRISIDDGDISYSAQGEVPGHILNQFSMDEHNGFFRIATTVGQVWSGESSNNVYILDENLERVSEIEDIAPGEKIYSARFMGGKAYLVTFKKVDPFFTLDLSDPYDPKILGKLKIPGYSDYLHPFDENHIIGIGKDTVEPLGSESWGRDFAWYQGLKIALFDVSDFENPKEVAKIIIGDRGTNSPSLYDHKAFLFDREKELLVIPVSLFEIPNEIKEQNNGYTGSTSGEFKFQGAYVYGLSIEDGFEFKGRITHTDEQDVLKSGYYGYWGSSSVTRSLYIGNVLYTLSDNMVKMNDLNTLSEINSVNLM